MKPLPGFILECWDAAVKMRHEGVPMEDIQTGLRATVIEGAHARGMVLDERDLPPWLLRNCLACSDTGWQLCSRLVRGESVEAFRRCFCQAAGGAAQRTDDDVASTAARGWKQLGRR